MKARAEINSADADILIAAANSYAQGDDQAADVLHRMLAPAIRGSAGRILHPHSHEIEDVVQETLMAVFRYLRKEKGFGGNLRKLAVTIGNNRCRDILRWQKRRPHVPIEPLANWIADRSRSPLDELADNEIIALLTEALSRLGVQCRMLLRALYVDRVPATEIRRRIGLKTVQGVYYRKSICLKEALRLLNLRLLERPIQRDRVDYPRPEATGEVDHDRED